MTDEEYYKKAQKIVKAKRDFKHHAAVFAVIMPFLLIVNLWTSPGYLWFFWAFMGWGMGLMGQYYEAYVKPRQRSNETAEVEREMENLRRRDGRELPPRNRKDDLDDRLELRELRTNYDERDLV